MSGRFRQALDLQCELARLTLLRARFRIRRTLDRIRSPRQWVATVTAGIFFAMYLINGVFILSSREPADPERLRLWLSGGMVVYVIYHALRCAWAGRNEDLQWTAAEQLWIGGAPIPRGAAAIYHVGSLVVPTALKTGLLAIVLAIDVDRLELLCIGVFTSLLLLELVRLSIARVAAALSDSARGWFRVGATLIAATVGLQVVARLMASIGPQANTWDMILGSFRSLGETVASDPIQWLALPWKASSSVAVTGQYTALTFLQLSAAIAMLPLAIWALVAVDGWVNRYTLRQEQTRLRRGEFRRSRQAIAMDAPSQQSTLGVQIAATLMPRIPAVAGDTVALIARSWISVRRHWATILCSFLIPMLLCLSPLAIGRPNEQWLFVVAGIALCTLMLAPPALRIDFRRDLRRMQLLRSLPIGPVAMVVGQLAVPVLITWAFQGLTLLIAALIVGPGVVPLLHWTGMLAALAVFAFAAENALFLAYPHHEGSEGVAMMVRAKLTFLGKAVVMLAALTALVAWGTLCQRLLPPSWSMLLTVSGAIIGTWTVAIAALALTTRCWQRFDLSLDIPPS